MMKKLLLPLAILAATPTLAQAGGADQFKMRCAMCHIGPGGKPSTLGPSLSRVVGRKAASTGFNYSPALKKSGLVWTKANLDKYLSNPGKLVPGTKMVISVPDAAQRAAIVGHLATMK